MFDASINQLRAELSELLPMIPEEYKKVLNDDRTSPKLRIETMKDLMDRLGLVAVKGVVSKNVNATVDSRDLEAEMDDLLGRQEAIQGEIRETKAQLEAGDG
jgi:hypothetical protein